MSARKSLEEKIERLAALKEGPLEASALEKLKAALSSSNNALCAAGARAASRCGEAELVPELVAAFERFMDGGDSDKGCLAKTALAESLNQLRYDRPDVFLRGIDHVQMEPVYGGRADVAADLRCACAEGLLRVGHPDLMRLLTGLLFDAEVGPRRAAVRALRLVASDAAELLLRAKVLAADPELSVMGDCFLALMEIAPRASLRFVGRSIEPADPALAEEAALAVGESRLPEALELLMERWRGSVGPELKEALLLPMALTRQEAALEFLLAAVQNEPTERAAAAVAALVTFDDAGERRRRIEQAVDKRGEQAVTEAWRRTFGQVS